MNENVSRRRGVILENAILDQAWLLLNQIGYSKLTMDDVAHAAKTSKNAIYRRWPQKCHLILAAVNRKAPALEGKISDHGSLKEDLIALFKVLDPIFGIIKPDDLRDVISDMLSHATYYDLFSFVNHENDISKSIETIITRANQRKEISLSIDTISEKALNLPTLLIINEIVLHGRLNEASSKDIINNILLPIYKVHK
ncbi:TetR/AcrR family transcriptional regulator [Clostridium diolis]|uniref:AcrR family transcriptional regulator n=1 Tax=Clostridium diolis TaxID=223919 RepID=A0AAV3VBQ4_9CLOT|nr:TetR/AcrR family transcriptional regulator [Clostridium diolis]QES73337.1 TetR/AcrR family transcriptional regulator [Clostridium diolis]GEA32166.1 AcrR family transcriptional regulator [Clostridium diolis]